MSADSNRFAMPCRMCERPFLYVKGRPLPKHFPFCSRRCKMADLDNWLSERYVLGAEGELTEANEDDAEEI